VLRPYAAALPALARKGVNVEGVYEAARRAGRELIAEGAVREETAQQVARPLVRREVYLRAVNAGFRRALQRLQQRQSSATGQQAARAEDPQKGE